MIILGMEILHVVKVETGYHPGIAARVNSVRVVGEERPHAQAPMGVVRARVDALHFIEHNALVHKRIVLVLDLVVPPLLRENSGIAHGPGVQHGVEIDVDEVVKILEVATRHRVASTIGKRHRVQERLQARLQELYKGLLEGVLAAAAKDGVLQDVGDAVRVFRRGAEHHAKGLVLVCWLHHGNKFCASFVVFEQVARTGELFHVFHAGARPTVHLLPNGIRGGNRRIHYADAGLHRHGPGSPNCRRCNGRDRYREWRHLPSKLGNPTRQCCVLASPTSNAHPCHSCACHACRHGPRYLLRKERRLHSLHSSRRTRANGGNSTRLDVLRALPRARETSEERHYHPDVCLGRRYCPAELEPCAKMT
mmetsp:Transcript_101881/g.287458  ORF Transcript_101881/g.287458 Transcript_101881/m.287458 type:complete len:365 (-) Transcript_101881:19-1113(-)